MSAWRNESSPLGMSPEGMSLPSPKGSTRERERERERQIIFKDKSTFSCTLQEALMTVRGGGKALSLFVLLI